MKSEYETCGYGSGHRVAILFNQRPEFLYHYFALNALGASVVPVNPDYTLDEISYIVEHSEASLFICLPQTIELINSNPEKFPKTPTLLLNEFGGNIPIPK